jgi:Na+/proline symporter
MEQLKVTYPELMTYLIVIGAVVGAVLGLIILLVAWKRGRKNLGYIAIPVCIILGALSPLLALIAFGIFFWLAFRSKQLLEEVQVANEEPIDVSVSEPKES